MVTTGASFVHEPKVTRMFGGKLCSWQTLARAELAGRGLCKLDRDQEGTVVTWYVRYGVDEQGTARGGAQKYKRYRDAHKGWADLLANAQEGK